MASLASFCCDGCVALNSNKPKFFWEDQIYAFANITSVLCCIDVQIPWLHHSVKFCFAVSWHSPCYPQCEVDTRRHDRSNTASGRCVQGGNREVEGSIEAQGYFVNVRL